MPVEFGVVFTGAGICLAVAVLFERWKQKQPEP